MWSFIDVSIGSCTKDSYNETTRWDRIITLVQELEHGGIQALLWLSRSFNQGKRDK